MVSELKLSALLAVLLPLDFRIRLTGYHHSKHRKLFFVLSLTSIGAFSSPRYGKYSPFLRQGEIKLPYHT